MSTPTTTAPPTLILYQYPACPYCRRVLDTLDALGVKAELRDTRADPRHRAALVALMGDSQVPTLLIDGEPMRESADIVDWLYETFGGGRRPPRSGW